MTAIVSFYLIAILAQRVRSHSLQERNVLMALNAVLVLRTRIEKCSASEFQKTLTFKMMLHMLGAEPFLWKWVLFAWEWKMISISKAEHLPSFWNRGPGGTRKWPISCIKGTMFKCYVTQWSATRLCGGLNV